MIEINLLPKNYRKGSGGLALGKSGLYAAGGAIMVVLLMAGISFNQMGQLSKLNSSIAKANERASMLRADIKVVDGLIDIKSKIHQRMTAVERLDRHRSAWVRILGDMARNVPEFVWLSEFSEIPPEIVANNNGEEVDSAAAAQAASSVAPVRPALIKGHAFTLNSLAAFMIKMMRSDYFDEVELVNTEDKVFQGEKAYEFELSANVHYLSDEEMRSLVAQTNNQAKNGPKHTSLN